MDRSPKASATSLAVGELTLSPGTPGDLVLWVARARLFCTTNYSTKYCSDCLELAKDPPAIEVIYLHKYFQIIIYFI